MRNGIRVIKMQIVTDDDSGMAGFVPEMWQNWSNYRPSFGLGFGHDVIEHGLMKQTGAFDEEVAAHGAILFTTDFLGYMSGSMFYTPAEGLASGMSSQFRESTVGYIRTPPKHYGVTWEERRKVVEFAYEYVGHMAKEWHLEASNWTNEDCTKDAVCENSPCGDSLICKGDCQPACECDECNNPFVGREAFRLILGWMLYGYSRAKAAYKGESWSAFMLKKAVETESEKAMKNFSEYAGSGAIFTMRLNLNSEEVTIKPPRDIYGEW